MYSLQLKFQSRRRYRPQSGSSCFGWGLLMMHFRNASYHIAFNEDESKASMLDRCVEAGCGNNPNVGFIQFPQECPINEEVGWLGQKNQWEVGANWALSSLKVIFCRRLLCTRIKSIWKSWLRKKIGFLERLCCPNRFQQAITKDAGCKHFCNWAKSSEQSECCMRRGREQVWVYTSIVVLQNNCVGHNKHD